MATNIKLFSNELLIGISKSIVIKESAYLEPVYITGFEQPTVIYKKDKTPIILLDEVIICRCDFQLFKNSYITIRLDNTNVQIAITQSYRNIKKFGNYILLNDVLLYGCQKYLN
jgi:hypothetical protein